MDKPIVRVRLLRALTVLVFTSATLAICNWQVGQHEALATMDGVITLSTPAYIAGATGRNDERDADLYPAVAFDAVLQRYLVVWLTARNAGSSSDGFDVYGLFLDPAGQPVGNQFRITDSQTAARNSLPAVSAGNGEFAVVWAARGSKCRLYAQRVIDGAAHTDRTLIATTTHHHSPALVYNPDRNRYVVAFVAGDDYLPMTLFGANTADCGNNASSTSEIHAMEFEFNGDNLVTSEAVVVSSAGGGSFRPALAHSIGLSRYLIAWEDRRNAGADPFAFDVYDQPLSADLTTTVDNAPLATGARYENYDNTATWTPRPTLAASDNGFLAAWFMRRTDNSAVIYTVAGALVTTTLTSTQPVTVAQVSFAQSHIGQSPTGFLTSIYHHGAQEYLVGMTTHLESVWGYLSLARIQRVGSDGQLIQRNGNAQLAPGVGYSIDNDNDDQIAIDLASWTTGDTAHYAAVYAKHPLNRSAQDFDIWGVQMQLSVSVATPTSTALPMPTRQTLYLPVIAQEP